MYTKRFQKGSIKYICEKCDYYTNRKSQYERHLQTKKHNETNETKMKHTCKKCNKLYSSRTSLWRHKKSCENGNNDTIVKKVPNSLEEMFMELVEKNQELQTQLLELAKEPKTIVSLSVLAFCFLQLSQAKQSEFASSTISLILGTYLGSTVSANNNNNNNNKK